MPHDKFPQRMTAAEFRASGIDPRRQAKRRSGEHNAQAAFFSVLQFNLRAYPNLKFIYATPNAAKRSPQMITIMKREGLKPGVPDLFIPFSSKGYGGAWIEMKFGDNKMTPAQVEYRDFLITQNYAFKTCYTLDQALDFTEFYLGIELQRPV